MSDQNPSQNYDLAITARQVFADFPAAIDEHFYNGEYTLSEYRSIEIIEPDNTIVEMSHTQMTSVDGDGVNYQGQLDASWPDFSVGIDLRTGGIIYENTGGIELMGMSSADMVLRALRL